MLFKIRFADGADIARAIRPCLSTRIDVGSDSMAPTSSAPGEGRKNVDIAPTIGHLLGIDVGRVSGKVLREALVQ